jgi:hypothetical protein
MRISEVLSDESKWTKGAFARDTEGKEVPAEDEKAVRWCLVGAAIKCRKDYKLFRHPILTDWWEWKPGFSIVRFNDADTTTFKDIRRVVAEFEALN